MISPHLKWAVPALQLLVLIPNVVFAIHTDVVIFDNGDRLTGEFKSLDRGMLSFKTEATGTINIEWENVAFLSSDQNIQVETSSGLRYLGKLQKAEDEGTLLVSSGQDTTELQNEKVVKLATIDKEGWRNWDIDLSAGYNFASADAATQFNIGATASHRTITRIIGADLSAIVSDSSTSETSENASLNFNWTKLRQKRWFNTGTLGFSKNTELGLNLRTSIGAGIGRLLVETNRSTFALGGGLKVSREDNIDVEEDTDSLEAYGSLSWDWFHHDSPEWDLSTDFQLIPSLTQSGRVRYDFDTTISWEIFHDFYWTIQLYDNFDSQPPTTGAANHDYGIITSLSYDLK